MKLPALIDLLHDLDKNQTSNIRDSLHSRGDFTIKGPAEILKVANENWVHLTAEQRQRRLHRLLNFTVPAKVITIAKKPGQTKRVKPCKSTTLTKKVKLS